MLGPINHSIGSHRFNPLAHLVHFLYLFRSIHSPVLQASLMLIDALAHLSRCQPQLRRVCDGLLHTPAPLWAPKR